MAELRRAGWGATSGRAALQGLDTGLRSGVGRDLRVRRVAVILNFLRDYIPWQRRSERGRDLRARRGSLSRTENQHAPPASQ